MYLNYFNKTGHLLYMLMCNVIIMCNTYTCTLNISNTQTKSDCDLNCFFFFFFAIVLSVIESEVFLILPLVDYNFFSFIKQDT